MQPERTEKAAGIKADGPSGRAVLLKYRGPYGYDELLDFFSARAIPGVETIHGGSYCRTVRLPTPGGGQVSGHIRVGHVPGENAVSLRVSACLEAVLPEVSDRVERMFGLYCDPDAVSPVLRSMDDIRPGLFREGVRVPGCFDAFETSVRAVLGQQITVKAAGTLAGRVVRAFGSPCDPDIDGLEYVFPSPREMLEADDAAGRLGRAGVISARANTILALARQLDRGYIRLTPDASAEEEMEKLLAIKGIGSWTARYIAMRTMCYPDAFLETDLGVRRALGGCSPREAAAMAQKWAPWRSYAVASLWNSH